MKILLSGVWVLSSLVVCAQANNQPLVDERATLLWVQRQADKIDSVLDVAVRGADQATLLLQMFNVWHDFDAVTHAGLYCHEVRASAEKGRAYCDLFYFRQAKDLASLQIRATEARLQAIRMREAAAACLLSSSGSTPYGLADVLREDADIVVNDLKDALSVRDFHILAQKLEHALRILHDMEYLSETLPNCRATRDYILVATVACTRALASDHWAAAEAEVNTALTAVERILQSAGCR